MLSNSPTEIKEKFKWERGVTYFTKHDLKAKGTKLPCPVEDMTEINDLFIIFVMSINGASLNAFRHLCTSSLNPFFPQPYLPRNATFENNGFYIPNKFRKLVWRDWYSQLVDFLRCFGSIHH